MQMDSISTGYKSNLTTGDVQVEENLQGKLSDHLHFDLENKGNVMEYNTCNSADQ